MIFKKDEGREMRWRMSEGDEAGNMKITGEEKCKEGIRGNVIFKHKHRMEGKSEENKGREEIKWRMREERNEAGHNNNRKKKEKWKQKELQSNMFREKFNLRRIKVEDWTNITPPTLNLSGKKFENNNRVSNGPRSTLEKRWSSGTFRRDDVDEMILWKGPEMKHKRKKKYGKEF